MSMGPIVLIYSAISVLASIANILTKVFLPLAIYNDAKAHYNKNTTLYTVLAVFFPLIAGIVYMVVRNNPDQVDYTLLAKNCLNCGSPCNGAEFMCHNCGSSQFTDAYGNEDTDARKKKAKGFMIGAIICYSLGIILGIITAALSMAYSFSFFGDIANMI